MYCLDELATEVDHIKPWIWDHDDSPDNLVASCHRCNAIGSDLIFDDFEAKREYIIARRKRKRTGLYLEANCPYCEKSFKPGVTGTNICCYECAES